MLQFLQAALPTEGEKIENDDIALKMLRKEIDYDPDQEDWSYLSPHSPNEKGKEIDDDPIKIFLIFNKLGSSADPVKLDRLIEKYFPKPKYDIDFFHLVRGKADKVETQVGKFKTKNIRSQRLEKHLNKVINSGEYSYIFIAGGDGTISSVINYLANCPIPIVIIPSGTGNAIAQEFGISNFCGFLCYFSCFFNLVFRSPTLSLLIPT